MFKRSAMKRVAKIDARRQQMVANLVRPGESCVDNCYGRIRLGGGEYRELADRGFVFVTPAAVLVALGEDISIMTYSDRFDFEHLVSFEVTESGFISVWQPPNDQPKMTVEFAGMMALLNEAW